MLICVMPYTYANEKYDFDNTVTSVWYERVQAVLGPLMGNVKGRQVRRRDCYNGSVNLIVVVPSYVCGARLKIGLDIIS